MTNATPSSGHRNNSTSSDTAHNALNMVQGKVASMINLCTPASGGALNRCFSKRPIIARMRKARAFSTPGDMPSCGGGAWALLLNQEDILLCCRQCCLRRRLAQRCIVLQGSRSSRITVCATCASALLCLQRCFCSSALRQAVSALHALLAIRRSGRLRTSAGNRSTPPARAKPRTAMQRATHSPDGPPAIGRIFFWHVHKNCAPADVW